MHVRLLPSLGMPVVEDDTGDFLGELGGLLIDPDKGKIEGIFILVRGFFSGTEYFCLSDDIVRIGTRIGIRSADAVSLPEEFMRLQTLFADPRTILGQQIRTKSGRIIGRCDDLQFNTKSFRLEWMFPRRLWRWGVALPASEILEVLPDAIIVRDTVLPEPERATETPVPTLSDLTETTPASRVVRK